MVVRPRRAVPGDRLVVLVCAVSGVILNWISRLSIKICKLGLSKTLNGLVLLSYCLWDLWPLTLSWPRCLLSGNRSLELVNVVLWKSSGGI
jgi:hypothetical protein